MIVDAGLDLVFSVFGGFVASLLDLLPPPPGWVITAYDVGSDLYDVVSTIETWLPVDLALTITGAVLATFVVAQVIGLVRVVASYLTFGGGAT